MRCTTYPQVLPMSCILVQNRDTGRKDRRVTQRYRLTKYTTLPISLTAPLTLQHFIHAQNQKLQHHEHVQALSRLRGSNSTRALPYSVCDWRLPTAVPAHNPAPASAYHTRVTAASTAFCAWRGAADECTSSGARQLPRHGEKEKVDGRRESGQGRTRPAASRPARRPGGDAGLAAAG